MFFDFFCHICHTLFINCCVYADCSSVAKVKL